MAGESRWSGIHLHAAYPRTSIDRSMGLSEHLRQNGYLRSATRDRDVSAVS
jgi:hypothetical protein